MLTNNSVGILSVGHYLPEQCISNEHFVDRGLDTTPEWIQIRSGINTRQIADVHQPTSTLAFLADNHCLRPSFDTNLLDFIIVATATPDHHGFPSTACLVQDKLKLSRPIECFDITAACSGFAYALSLAYAKISSGLGQYGLVIGAETLSRMVDWSDRRTCILFGDGAGAALVGPVTSGGFFGFDQGSDGKSAGILACHPQDNAEQFSGKVAPPSMPMIQMDGQAVFKKGIQVVVKSLKTLIHQHDVSIDDIDHVICHQANRRILESVSSQLNIPFEKFLMNIDRVGNTSAASILWSCLNPLKMEQFSLGIPWYWSALAQGLLGQVFC